MKKFRKFLDGLFFEIWLWWKIPSQLWYFDHKEVEGHEVILAINARAAERLKRTLPDWKRSVARGNQYFDPYPHVDTLIFASGPYMLQSLIRGRGFSVGSIAEFATSFSLYFPCQLINMTIPPPGQLSLKGRSFGHFDQ